MFRLITLCAALAAALVMVAPSPAAKSGRGTGVIFFELGSIGCAFIGTTADGQQVFAFGPAGSVGAPQIHFLGGDSFADPDVGWTCTGTPIFTSVPPITEPLVITGLTCRVESGLPTTIPLGTLTTPGTAIYHANGTVQLICPPSTRI